MANGKEDIQVQFDPVTLLPIFDRTKWLTAEELREACKNEESPRESMRKLRQRIHIGPNPMNLRMRGV